MQEDIPLDDARRIIAGSVCPRVRAICVDSLSDAVTRASGSVPDYTLRTVLAVTMRDACGCSAALELARDIEWRKS